MPNLTDDELLAALGVDEDPEPTPTYSPREQRIIAGFEEIQRFVEQHGRSPRHGEGLDIFERLYAVRLHRLRELEDARTLLAPLDHQGLLKGDASTAFVAADDMDDEELLSALGAAEDDDTDITKLRHVRPYEEKRAAEVIAEREPCKDFERFEPIFELAQRELAAGLRHSRRFGKDASIDVGDFFILDGQFVYVAAKGEEFVTRNGHPDARLRVIYANGTESNLLLRSLQRALYKDETGRRVIKPEDGGLFANTWNEDHVDSGTIYVLRSLSKHPFIAEHREIIHKIGVTKGSVRTRIANAANDPTYLLADVEVVAEYKLGNLNRSKLEGIFHRLFAPARLNLTIKDRFGRPVQPQEWFLVPLHIIDEAVQRLHDGSITDVTYDPETAKFVETG